MSWAVGYDDRWERDIGYGVPAYCDNTFCDKEINRGLSYVCGGEPYGGDDGCGLYFCSEHLRGGDFCDACASSSEPYEPKPDHPDWFEHKMTDESWSDWREENGF